MTTTGNVSCRLARFIAGFPTNRLPPAARHATSRAVLDAIGVMAAASGSSTEVAAFLRLARHGGGGECTLLGLGTGVGVQEAAFGNGALAHALDYEDVFDAAPCHPNAASLPAGLAIAQHLRGVAGSEFLAAAALGCDIACRTSLGAGGTLAARGWYPPPLLSALGAASAVARLLGAGERQVTDSWSLVLLQLGSPGDIGSDGTTSIRATREAFSASAAVTAAMLAADGVRGFADPLGGATGFFRQYAGITAPADVLLEDLGERFFVEELSFKPWPSCRGTHALIELATGFVAGKRLMAGSIDTIEVSVGAPQRRLAEPLPRKQAPATAIDARFSLPFCIALAMVRGHVTLDDFDEASLRDPEILGLARRIEFHFHDDGPGTSATAGGMRIRLVDGTVLDASLAQPSGSPASPVSDEQLIAKFLDCCGRAARPPSARLANEMAQRFLQLDDEPDVGALLATLFPDDV
jgi:2-methylcitrate dehydratase PrpD